jgi:uncharacterized membrane protein YagU involved in acid resistance
VVGRHEREDLTIARDTYGPTGRVRLIREVLRAGTVAGLAMVPFAAVFRGLGLRVNEYGRKTLELIVGSVSPPVHHVLTFIQHIAISWVVAVPLILLLGRISRKRDRILVGLGYGAAFYVAVNSLALPLAFGDPTPWRLGFAVVYPSLSIHLVYGLTVAVLVRPTEPLLPPDPSSEPMPR